jgi:DNA-binding CsgD family transcriptional regulator/tetratricopeptide (TPR) repeat protein
LVSRNVERRLDGAGLPSPSGEMSERHEQALAVANRHIIERPRLTRLLDETTARVILLVAPAGYGKTVLARQWLNTRQHAFYRATESARDIAVLGMNLLDLAQGITRSGDRFEQWLQTRRGTGASPVAAELLAEDLLQWPDGAWLAIDDYHHLGDQAEQLIRRLRDVPGMRLILTSRTRPQWCTSRDLLYGDIYEIGPSELAMTRTEANGVLSGLGEVATEIIELAAGWPAVIGLAAFTSSPRVSQAESLPPTLHGYIAEELYSTVAPGAKIGLAQLSLIGAPSEVLARKVLGEETELILQEGLRVGFLTEYQPGSFAFHPLLREFLWEKLVELPNRERSLSLSSVVDVLAEGRLWDDAFEIIRRFELYDALEPLLSLALYDLLDRGMLATLEQLVLFAREEESDTPVIDLAAAELAFRQGLHERSRSLAASAALRLDQQSDLVSRAHCRSGHAAYFLDDVDNAARSFELAHRTAQTQADRQKAIWGEFLAALDRESDEATTLLSEFELASGSTADDILRIQNGRLHLGMRIGSVTVGLRGAEAIASLVTGARDPVVRASFWHVYSGALRLAARYDDALKAAEQAIGEIARFELGFARGYIEISRALAYMGVSDYDAAAASLDEAAIVARRTGDLFVEISEKINRCRLCLLLNQPEDALHATSGDWPDNMPLGLRGELLACRTLALSRPGMPGDASLQVSDVEVITRENEARALARVTHTLIAFESGERLRTEELVGSFKDAVSRSVLDPYVFAFKLDQRFPRLLYRVPTLRPSLDDLRSVVGATPAAREALSPKNLPEAAALTPREAEVLDLLAAGKTNAEIASTLFLASHTVKVHVRRILQKLGVRTRTEAAIYAVTTRRPEAAEPAQPREAPQTQD